MPAPEKTRRPWWFRLLRGLFFLVIALVTLVALVVAVENWRGERAWRAYEARLKADGERLTFAEILPPAPPAESNFGALPLFERLFAYTPGDGLDTNAMQAFTVFEIPQVPRAGRGSDGQSPDEVGLLAAKFREMAPNGVARPAESPDYPPVPAGASDAEVVLAALAVADPLLAEVCAALERPEARFAIHFDEAFMALLPHLAKIKGIQSHLRVRILARLAAGQTDRARTELDCAFRLANAVGDEPLLISQLVHFAQCFATLGSFHPGLEAHVWSDADLVRIQGRLREWDFLAGIERAFEGERAGCNGTMEAMLGRPELAETLGMFGSVPPDYPAFLRRIPRGFIRQNQIALNRFHTGVLREVRAPGARQDLKGLLARLSRFQKDQMGAAAGGFPPYRVFVRMLIPALEKAVDKAARADAVVALADVACALERHRLAHGEYPARLADLDAGLLAGPATDRLGDGPPRYERLADGTYRLWSVGPDGKDDGGVWKKSKSGPELDLPWPRSGDAFRLF